MNARKFKVHIGTVAFSALIFSFFWSSFAHAKARPNHLHQDLIGESDLLLGIKAGMVVSGHEPQKQVGGELAIPSAPRGRLGLVAEFIYDIPRFEIGGYWASRAGLRNEEWTQGFAVPVLIKLPLELSSENEKESSGPGGTIDLEIGGGYEGRWIFSSKKPEQTSQGALVGTLGCLVDFNEFLLSVELRYLHGLKPILNSVSQGTEPRDFELLIGYSWRE